MSHNPNSPPRGWTPNVDPQQQIIPPPIGSRVNVIPNSLAHPPMSWTVSTVTDGGMIPPPIGSAVHPVACPGRGQGNPGNYNLNSGGSRFNEQNPAVPPPIGSTPANLLAGCVIPPPIGSQPTNYMGQSIQPPVGAMVNPPATGGTGGYGGYANQPNPTVSTFDEGRFRDGNPMIPPPIGSSPANQLSGQVIPPPSTPWMMPPPGR